MTLLQLAALLFSLRRIGYEKRKAEDLRAFCALLEQLGGALGSEAAPMPELIGSLLPRADGAAAVFLQTLADSMDQLGAFSFFELWKSALYASRAVLDSESARAIAELGSFLGRYELNSQLRAVDACHKSLCIRLETLRQRFPQTERLTLGLSLAASALLGIILI